MINKKPNRLNEDYSVLKNPSPFQIGRAPDFQRNRDEEANLQYQVRRAEEANTFYQKQILVAQLEQLEVPIMQVFQDIIKLRTIIGEKKSMQILPKNKKILLSNIEKKLDKINKFITNELLVDLDQLTVIDGEIDG